MKKTFLFLVSCIYFQLVTSCGTYNSLHHIPQLTSYDNTIPIVKKHSNTLFTSGNNSLLKNKQNLWELYIEGDPLQRGLAFGSLSDSLLKKQETVFFSKINTIVPSKFKQRLLRNFLKWYNRKLYLNVTDEYKTEIYGVSRYSSPNFDNFAPPYLRCLYLHGAHDIGHALQDLALVGCSSFAAWGEKTEDGSLILGRNFDFYAGDDFAKDKIVAFVKPSQGYPFMMVTWAGMIGACSGMNNEGLTITLNAGKSVIPLIAKTPISILSREILQYAKNIDEAILIAKKRKVFVSESIMIGSANDNKAILIEVSPDSFGVYDVVNGNQLICSNHFQSENLKNNKRNKNQILNSHSKYRFDRMIELFNKNPKINPKTASEILRNKEGLNDLPLGYGNEKSLNQLLAHHGVIFKPAQKLVWISANPYQMGEFVCYDLNKIFNDRNPKEEVVSLQQENLNIPKDIFLESEAYKKYEKFRTEDRVLDDLLISNKDVSNDFIINYQSLNSNYWDVYYKVGLYYFHKKMYKSAKEQFEMALTKEITTLPKKTEIINYLKKIQRKL